MRFRVHAERLAAEEGVEMQYIQRMKSFRKETDVVMGTMLHVTTPRCGRRRSDCVIAGAASGKTIDSAATIRSNTRSFHLDKPLDLDDVPVSTDGRRDAKPVSSNFGSLENWHWNLIRP
ncbi:MAG TPA: hypothetical protein VMU84_17890 [Thermoanaerobaculia bacterium]|nr:hypothetical protein [Thermoanaerobaculia bacterium]